jgi:ribosomal protein S18 acetylase RimI-like enzyme
LARPTSDYVLRPFRRQDLDQVVALEKVCFPERPYTRLEFLLLSAQAGDGFLVAEDGGRVSGYVASMVEGRVGVIMSIAVSPQLRRGGIGDALMRSALNHMVGCGWIWLLVNQKNVAAISLYHKHLFRETGRIIKGYYPNRDDAVEMVRIS